MIFLLGQHQVSLQQRLGRALHGDACQSAHLGQLPIEGIKLLVVGGAHRSSLAAYEERDRGPQLNGW
jgi:hypothetical protein